MSDAEKQPEPKAPTEPNLEKESISETDVESKDVTDTESKEAEKVACFIDNEIKDNADMKVETACPEKVTEENELDFEDEREHTTIVNGKSKESNEVKEEGEGDETQTEEGACTPEKKKAEESKDDGECSDGGDEDLEEGELNEKEEIGGGATNSKPTSATKSLCRFYSRGICYFGANCRFSHINASGNNYYSMFSTTTPTPSARGTYDTSSYYDSSTMMGHTHRSGPLPSRSGSDFVPPPSACSEPALAEECAWVRGLETAKELVKRAHKRKIEDKNFSEKSLNLSLEKNEKNEIFIERDTRDSYKRKRRDMIEFPKYDEPLEAAYDDYREPYREVGFDHFDVRYHREERKGGDRRMDREPRDTHKRDFRPKSPRSKERYRDDRIDRLDEVEPPPRPSHYLSRNVNNVNTFFDPWRRSKSPKGTARRSRSRSGSYSSVSSYSWSDRSFSSNSYSRSSRSSSRSPPHQKRKLSPTITNSLVSDRPGPLLTNTFTTMRDKKPQHTGGLPARSRTPSISRSRSFSRSISMSSVSSASSARGSSRERDSLSNSSGSRTGRQNSTSILRKQDENAALPVGKTVDPPKVSGPPPAAVPLPSMYLNYPLRESTTIHDTIKSPVIEESEIDPLEEQFLHPKKPEIEKPFPSLQHLLPSNDKIKEPLKVASHKPQIKLTLLPKKEFDRKSMDDPSKSAGFYFGLKGPLSPPTPPVITKPTPVLLPKKSASSRRDELLKQLKAVEDAIARKRAKFG